MQLPLACVGRVEIVKDIQGHNLAQDLTRLQISLFFWIFRFLGFFGFFEFFGHFLGPGGLPKGPGMDYASYGPSFSPN